MREECFTLPVCIIVFSLSFELRAPAMAYVDHSFSITDEDLMVDGPYIVRNRPPIREIALAVSLLVFGSLGIVIGVFMACNQVGGDRAHGTDPCLQTPTLDFFIFFPF